MIKGKTQEYAKVLACQRCGRDISKFVELNLEVVSDFSPIIIEGEKGYFVKQGLAVHHIDPFKPRCEDAVVWMNTRDILHDRVRFDQSFHGGYGYDKGPNTLCHCSNTVGSMYTNEWHHEFFYFEPDSKTTFWSDADELDPTRIERLYDYNRRSKQKHG